MAQRKVRGRARYATAKESLDRINDKDCIKITFDLAPGHEEKYDSMPFTGWLHNDQAIEITLGALRNCGWEGDMINDLTGIDKNAVMLVIDDEEYEGKTNARIKFVNRIAGFGAKNPLNEQQSMALAHRLRTKAAAHRQSYGTAAAKSEQRPSGNSRGAPGFDDAPLPEKSPWD